MANYFTDEQVAELAARLRPLIAEIVQETMRERAGNDADKQLVELKSATMDLIAAEGDKIYAEIVEEINTVVMPKVNRLAVGQMYNYMDEQFTTDFRRAAHDQEKTLTITDGKEDKSKYISKYVEKVFGEEDADC